MREFCEKRIIRKSWLPCDFFERPESEMPESNNSRKQAKPNRITIILDEKQEAQLR